MIGHASLVVLVAACSSAPHVERDAAVHDAAGDGAVDASPLLITCDQDLPPVTPIGSTEVLYPCETSPPLHGSPSRGCRLDLRTYPAGSPGTCASASIEPLEISLTQLPIVLDLPEAMSDATCGPACKRNDNPTPPHTFGLRIRVVYPPIGGPFLSMRVDPPWGIVAGNECAPSLCGDGYPSVNEFGVPLACVFSYCQEFGVITDDPSPPPARLTIATDETSNVHSNCCLYARE